MKVNIMWFRRDLRLEDNAALYHALIAGLPVVPLFIFDTKILSKLPNPKDRRVEFIHDALRAVQMQLKQVGSDLEVHHGTPEEIFAHLLGEYNIAHVFANHDYEPYGRERDDAIAKLLHANNAILQTYKDQVILEKDEVLKDDGTPYTVFTPYSRKWRSKLTPFQLRAYPTEKYYSRFCKLKPRKLPSLASLGFEQTGIAFPASQVADTILQHYTETRNFPSLDRGTSRMGVHLRFGTVSIRSLAKRALQRNDTYLNELIWRDFYQMILWHFPQVGNGKCFKPAYEFIQWRNNEQEFQRWCEGNTGYPIVDAGMRELNTTGYMHNRVRMIVASFLTKHLLIDWRWGEAYFAEKLLDFDLAANNGGWQWASGSGCDAAPYFRIFNPYLQTEKFDKELIYIKKWVPEFQEFSYPRPIVEHEAARKRALAVYAAALKS